MRCGHEWYRRQEQKPVQCPRCRSPYWNRGRVTAPDKKPVARQEVAIISPAASMAEVRAAVLASLPGVGFLGEPEKVPEVEICRTRVKNEVEARWYECRLPKHGPKTGHHLEPAEEFYE